MTDQEQTVTAEKMPPHRTHGRDHGRSVGHRTAGDATEATVFTWVGDRHQNVTGETLLVASFMHESTTFSESRTDLATFRESETEGGAVIESHRDTNAELGGAIEVATEAGVDLLPAVATHATPGGVVTREAFEHYRDRIVDVAREHADGIDGVVLAMHGAMVPEDGDDGEGPVIQAVREVVGPDVPIGVTLDHHGNVTETMLENADVLVAYETYPHVDMAETGERATELVLRVARGEVDPTMAIERPPVLATGANSDTSQSPMADLMACARELEDREGVLTVNVMPGFFRADIPVAGFSIPAVTDDDPELAREVAREMAETVWEHRNGFAVDRPSPAEAVAEAVAATEDGETTDGPVVLADVGDNPGGGAPGDETALLRALLDAGVESAGVAMIHDPAVVAACREAGVRESVTVDLGAKAADSWTNTLEGLDCYVKAITDGRFVKTGPMETGRLQDWGTAVLLQCGENRGVNVVVTERRHQPYDAELWRHVGVQPERLNAVAVKSSNHYRGAYEPVESRVIPVDSPGLNVLDPARLDYERIRRPVFPVDEMADDAYPDW
jgi:microcystin degradation protein MlrC